MYETNKKFNRKDCCYVVKEYLINYLYFLLDKVDPAFYNEASKSVERFISNLSALGEQNE